MAKFLQSSPIIQYILLKTITKFHLGVMIHKALISILKSFKKESYPWILEKFVWASWILPATKLIYKTSPWPLSNNIWWQIPLIHIGHCTNKNLLNVKFVKILERALANIWLVREIKVLLYLSVSASPCKRPSSKKSSCSVTSASPNKPNKPTNNSNNKNPC